jgi:hypothetical protein
MAFLSRHDAYRITHTILERIFSFFLLMLPFPPRANSA